MYLTTSRRRRWQLPLLLLVASLLAACAQFPDSGPRNWRDKPDNGGPLAAPPRIPEENSESTPAPPNPSPSRQAAPPNGCEDPDPLVIATCLDQVSALALLPDGTSALAAERSTGQIMRVQEGRPNQVVATLEVDAASGGLKGLVLSPSFDQDRLVYAYAATRSDNRVIRLTLDGAATPILTGIPVTPGDESGTLGVSKDGALVIATTAASAGPAGSALDGKILKIDAFGKPYRGNPDARSPIYSTGLHSPGGLCTSPVNGTVWVTDRAPQKDLLFKVVPGALTTPAWNWPDRPGVAGCVAQADSVAVAQRGASALFVLQKKQKSDDFTGLPATVLTRTYGRLSAMALGNLGLVWLGTENKRRGGVVVPSDDRVIRLPLIGGSASGAGPD